ncbi:hypothetical protein phiCbK_248 [Caulobacter phage phiCbK]|uniref:Uncharacterized protein n=5 Tax=Viruses TaxID=10239 RepID=J3UIL9_9CAUD|nr:hypothetical protein D865_gp070 [Caulobacter phage phiCbK]AFO71764.1 hypothetical protein phiCbK_248 [Caulobacter phage phiCbK]AFU86902.1 hypothetical protein CbK_gp070 [Caulobacter phage phiCbK]ARB14990.1 hypothetical protein Ccr32_gp071 [Caulobacter phage Ccr32]ARB15320.1 hypothetical protein Ccr34_gp071 [Caulobacter phage Ccr34]
MSNKNLVPVYSPEGKKELHTRLNAYDLVNGAGWTWKPGIETTPAAIPPYRAPAVGAEPAQAVLDRAGHRNDRTLTEVVGDEAEADADLDAAEDEVVEDAADEAPVAEEAPAAPAAPAARGRGRKPTAA